MFTCACSTCLMIPNYHIMSVEWTAPTYENIQKDSNVTTLCLWTEQRSGPITGLLLVWDSGHSSGVLGSSAGTYHEFQFSGSTIPVDKKISDLQYGAKLRSVGEARSGDDDELLDEQSYFFLTWQYWHFKGYAFVGMEIGQADGRLAALRPIFCFYPNIDKTERSRPEEEFSQPDWESSEPAYHAHAKSPPRLTISVE
ncbi:hypothetical protein RU639_009683 [Aspergillus parasiticus]